MNITIFYEIYDEKNNSQNIKLLILDVDGVLSDGKIIISNDGNEYKNFDVKDGLGLVLVQKLGMKVAVITGKSSSRIVADRLVALGLDSDDIFQGQKISLMHTKHLKINTYSKIVILHIWVMICQIAL